MFDIRTAQRAWSIALAIVVLICLSPSLTHGQIGGAAPSPPKDHVSSLAFAADGSLLAGAGLDKIPIWELKHGQLVRTITTGGARVFDIAFAPQGKLLASGCDDGKIRLWNVETGELSKVLTGDKADRYGRVAFAPDGKLLASTSHRAATGKVELQLWDLTRGELNRTLTDDGGASFVSFAFSPDGQVLAVGLVLGKEPNDSTGVRLWDIANNRWDRTLADTDGALFWLAFSPDGKSLASRGIRYLTGSHPVTLHQVSVWSVATGRTIWCVEDVHLAAREPTFSPDGKHVTTWGSAQGGGEVVMRDAASGRITAFVRVVYAGRVLFAYSPDGALLATCDEQLVELRDSRTGVVQQVLYPFPAKP